jgi:TonB-dependent starch-binding outer membrane protein SusC
MFKKRLTMQISKSVRRIALFLLSMVLSSGIIFAQEKTITGKVTAEGEGPLAGVNVTVQGTVIGAITDVNGAYSIKVPGTSAVLLFSSIGYSTKQVTIGSQSVIDMILLSDVRALNEVVVVGYGTRKREELTGSISTVSSKDMKISTAPSAVGRMQGQVAGVTVVNSNTPGGDAFVRVRGMGTINDSRPLYVIDGVPSDPGSSLNPDDIESISVLKDASSSAIYGTRGANGVILITTKRGMAGDKPSITFSTRVGVANAINQYDMLNAQEYAQSVWLRADNQGVPRPSALYGTGSTPVLPDYLTPTGAMAGAANTDPSTYSASNVITKANKAGTNWYDQIYQAGKTQEYDLSISGGTQKSTYAFSAGYADQQGILIHTDFKRYTFRSNSDAKVADWLKVGQSLSATFTQKLGDMGSDGEASPISQAYRIQPIIPVYDIMGKFAGTKSGPNFGNAENPVAQLTRNANNYDKYARAMGNFYAEATIINGLALKSLFGFDFGTTDQKYVTLANPEMAEAHPNDALAINHNYNMQWNWVNTLSYNKTFGPHNISAVVGTEAISSVYTEENAGRAVYFNNSFDYMQLNSGEANQTNSGYASEWSLFSEFGRVNYSMNGKYLLEAVVRRDGSSRFAKVNRYGIFPAVSAGWVISQEDFMAGTSNVINFLKLKGGWGKSGNDRIGNYNSYTTFAVNKIQSSYPLDGSTSGLTTGFQPSQYGNDNVTWEKTSTLDIGLDTRFLANTLSFGIDVWQRTTTDMLYQVQKPQVSGVANQPYVNIGDMKNTGFDLELGYSNKAMDGKFVYSINATLSHYKNEVTKLSNNSNEFITTASERQVDYSRAQVGHAFPEFFGYVVEGIFQTQAEVDAAPPFGTYNKPGHFKFKDVNNDGKIDASDRTYIGSPHPKLTGGMNINLAYGGLDLSVVFYGSYGNKMINYVRRWIDYGQFDGGLSKDALYKSWGSPYLKSNADATLPMYDVDPITQQNSSAFVEDASFLRMKNLQIGYNLPKSLLRNIKVESLNIYCQVTNLLTITKYSGLDPEYYSSDPRTLGLDRGATPTSRQIMFGIRLAL